MSAVSIQLAEVLPLPDGLPPSEPTPAPPKRGSPLPSPARDARQSEKIKNYEL